MFTKGKITKTAQTFLTYIIALIILIDGSSMYTNIVGSRISSGIVKLMLIVFCTASILIDRRIPKKGIIGAGAISLYMGIYILMTRYNAKPCLIYTMCFFILMLYYFQRIDRETLTEFLDAFSRIITLIALISIVFWLFGSMLHLIPKKAIYYLWGRNYPYVGYSYFGIYFENPIQAEGAIIRNTGVFTEAPSYVERLLWGLCIELFYPGKKTDKRRAIILIIATITTLSSKGFILMAYLFAVKWCFYNKSSTITKQIMHFATTIIVAILAVFVGRMVISNEMSTESSSMTRMDHLMSGFRTWFQHPIFGVGYNNTDAIAQNHIYATTPRGASMGIATFLAEGGIYMFFLYIGSMVVAFLQCKKKFPKLQKDVLFCIGALLISWFISNIGYSLMMLSLISLGYGFIIARTNTLKLFIKKLHIKRYVKKSCFKTARMRM